MDIDDILASLGSPSVPQEALDVQQLTRAWVNEKNAPEVLPWPEELMDRVLGRIRKQVCEPQVKSNERAGTDVWFFVKIELVEEQMGDMDPRTNFRSIIIQTELERFKFLVRSYLRVRIAKVGMALISISSPLPNG